MSNIWPRMLYWLEWHHIYSTFFNPTRWFSEYLTHHKWMTEWTDYLLPNPIQDHMMLQSTFVLAAMSRYGTYCCWVPSKRAFTRYCSSCLLLLHFGLSSYIALYFSVLEVGHPTLLFIVVGHPTRFTHCSGTSHVFHYCSGTSPSIF
jgi:hypothetical protein